MADKEAERIKFETERLKLTAALATIAGGGSLSLLLGNPPIERAIGNLNEMGHEPWTAPFGFAALRSGRAGSGSVRAERNPKGEVEV